MSRRWHGRLEANGALCGSGRNDSFASASEGWKIYRGAGPPLVFPPVVATHLVKLACELPEDARRSLDIWTCAELAATLQREGIVESISPQTVQRLLSSHKLKPWRVHHWLSSKVPRDGDFRLQVLQICDLYTRQLLPHERVLCIDEKTSLQPRTRTARNRPAQPNGVPIRVEHEYARKGALHLFASYDTRSGEVMGILRPRKRQVEVIELLEKIDRETPEGITLIHIVCDNASIHRGKQVCAWFEAHPRFRVQFMPVHCSWMNQIEQWFSILKRKRLVAPNFADLVDLEAKVLAFIDEWNHAAKPFNWTAKSFQKVLSKCEDTVLMAA